MKMAMFGRMNYYFRAFCVLCSCFLLCGCAILYYDHRTLVATVAPDQSGVCNFRLTLMSSTRYLEFTGLKVLAEHQSRLRVSIVNQTDGPFYIFSPSAGPAIKVGARKTELVFDGKLKPAGDSLGFPINTVRRISCEFKIEILDLPQLTHSIRVYRLNSSARM